MGVGDAAGVGREDVDVVDLAGDPPLHKAHVLIGGKLDRFAVAIEPGEGVVAIEVRIKDMRV